jgi:hypothetical protein
MQLLEYKKTHMKIRKPIMVIHVCNPSSQEAEAGGSQVLALPGLHDEILSQKAGWGRKIAKREWWGINI